jgi:signal transduction histidine kinase/CheY-like chemotaxis protein
MKPEQPADNPGDMPPDAESSKDDTQEIAPPATTEVAAAAAPDFSPAAAEALFPAIPVEALARTVPTDHALAQPIPAEALFGTDPNDLLVPGADLPPCTEIPVPSLEEVISETSDQIVADVARPREVSEASDTWFAGGGEMGALMRSFDWSQTALGSAAGWPPALGTAVNLMLGTSFPMLIVWGPEHIQLYNDAYRLIAGAKHPAALGRRASDTWPEIWDTMLSPMFRQVMSSGDPFTSEDRLFVVDRNGYVEETYFTFSYSAIRDERGRPGGVLVTCLETTERVLRERRLRTLHDLATHASRSATVSDAAQLIAATLAANPNDLPFSLLYFVDKDGVRARLGAASHVAPGTPASPDSVNLARGDERAGDGVVWPIARVVKSGLGEVVSNLPASASPLPAGPWPESADTAVALPFRHTGSEGPPSGVLVAGVSPRRALDEAYRGFLDQVAAHVSATLSTACALETERRRADALVESNRAKTAFFGNVSHELRTPLTLMLGPAADLLAGDHGPLSPAQRDQIRLLRRNSARLLKMVNSLLEFSQLEADRVDASFEPTDLAAFTNDLAIVFRSAIERAGLTMTIDCPPLDEPVYVDRAMWETIVLNLVSNALKFTFEGRIDVSLRATHDYVELLVSDTGSGIAPADLPHLFTHFHRVRGAHARSHEGSGVGLALVHELVRIHGGSVNVVSEPAMGSTFSVCLRKGHAHLPVDRIRRSRPLTSAPAGAAPFVEEALRWIDGGVDEPAREPVRVDDATVGAIGMSGVPVSDAARSARVLIADDHADMRQYLTRLLRRRWNVESVGDGPAVLEAVRDRRPDLIVADVMMPGLDGVALLRELRTNVDTAGIPVLLLSGRASEESKVEGLNAGAADYLVKPFSARELVAKIQGQVERLWLRRQADQERARLRSLFNNAPVPICILRGPELRYEFVNPPYMHLFGNRDLLGRTVHEGLPEIAGQGLFDALERVFRTGETFWGIEVPIRLAPKDAGTERPEEFFFNFVYQAMRGPDGEVDGIVVFAVDVTEQVIIRRKIEESIQTRDTFFAAAAHELRNPINALQLQLLSVLHAAEHGAEAPLQVDWVRGRVGKAAHQVSRLVRLVDNLLDVSRIASGRLHLELEPVDLAAVVAEALDRLDSTEQAQITRTLEPTMGQWDRLRLDQIVTNLVSNALKYGEGKPIDVTVRAHGGYALLEVSDRGIGIAAEHQERIFERFERVVADRRYAGFGLGLWITSRIVEEFGGGLSVRSQPGAGSTFIVRLPQRMSP